MFCSLDGALEDFYQRHIESSVELARQAGLFSAAVMSEVMAPDGQMANSEALQIFTERFGCRLIDVEQIHQTALQS